jgi:hypothetical protein
VRQKVIGQRLGYRLGIAGSWTFLPELVIVPARPGPARVVIDPEEMA